MYAANALSVIGLCTIGAALLTSDDANIEAIHPNPFDPNLANLTNFWSHVCFDLPRDFCVVNITLIGGVQAQTHSLLPQEL